MFRPAFFITAFALSTTLVQSAEAPRCAKSDIDFLTESMSDASGYCTGDIGYAWGGTADPTDVYRSLLCRCTMKPFVVPDCTVVKMGTVVTMAEHVDFVFTCPGKAKVVTMVARAPASTTNTTTPTPTVAASAGTAKCSADQMKTFSSNMAGASGGCSSSYDWAGSADPTKDQLSELCKCTIGSFEVPTCKVQKGEFSIPLDEHYKWVRGQCTTSSAPSNGSPSTTAPSTSAAPAPSTGYSSGVTSAPVGTPAAASSFASTIVMSGAVGATAIAAMLTAY